MNWTLTETLEVEIQPQVSDLDSDLTCPKISVGSDPGFCSEPVRTQWKVKYGVCSTLLTALIHCSAETADMKTSTTCPGQPGQAPVGSFIPLEEMEGWPEPGCSAVPASVHEGLLASPFEMKGKKNIGSKLFKSQLILFVFKLWTFEMWECQKCLAQAKLTHFSLAYL